MRQGIKLVGVRRTESSCSKYRWPSNYCPVKRRTTRKRAQAQAQAQGQPTSYGLRTRPYAIRGMGLKLTSKHESMIAGFHGKCSPYLHRDGLPCCCFLVGEV